MANVKITDLAAYTNPDSTDVLPIVDVGADVTKKVSIADLLENAGSGTASAPGIAFDGDSNTGIYRPGADQLAISTNGTGKLLIDSSGNLVVGDAADTNTYIGHPAADTLAITTGGSERLRITSDVACDVIGQVRASTGILFGTDTAAANALDDYEEGTWTVSFYDAAGGGNVSATTGTGYYTKIGNIVRAAFFVQNIDTSGMTAGNFLYYTLPVFHGAGIETGSAFVGATTIAGGVAVYLGPNTSRALLVDYSSGGAYALLTVSDFTSGIADIAVTLTYKAF